MWLPQLLVFLMPIMLQVLQIQMQPLEQGEPVPESTADNNHNNNNLDTDRVLYDQRQTGKYNIHVSIKDVAIIEVDQNELADESYNGDDDDYYYDDTALTIKPIKFATEASATTTTSTTTTAASTTSTVDPTVAPTTTNNSAYSAQLLADIAATQRQKPKTNNLIIMNTPTENSSTLPTKWQQARSKDEPITTTPITNIEYTPPQGQNSPIFKLKMQRAASPSGSVSTIASPVESSSRCRAHQYRDAQGKCHSKRSGSILRKLFGMLVSLPFAGNRRALHGHGLQVSPP